jgi:hypothetical protein
MKLYRLDAIRNYVVSKYNKQHISAEIRKEISDFFSPTYLINRYELKDLIFENHYMTSFLVDEDIVMKHLLNFNLKYNQNIQMYKFNKFHSIFADSDIHVYKSESFPVNYNEIVEKHYQKECIQNLINIKKESVRIDKQRKAHFETVLINDLPNDIRQSKIFSLDFEYNGNLVYEFGASLYDAGKIKNDYYIINFKTGSRDHQFQYNFGESTLIDDSELKILLVDYLNKSDYLLMHGGYNDILIMNKYGIELEDFPHLKILDTYHLYPKHFNENSQDNSTLVDLLTRFGVEYSNLHNAGNDARYTLEVLLEMDNALSNGVVLSNNKRKRHSPVL